jgi:hypothetical protein
MKKISLLLLTITFGIFLVSSNASAFEIGLDNWKFDPSAEIGGAYGAFAPIDEITFLGSLFIDQAGEGGHRATFTDSGFFSATGFQKDGIPIPACISGLGVEYELTGTFMSTGTNAALAGTDQDFVFDGRILDFYVDTSLDYGSTGTPAEFF